MTQLKVVYRKVEDLIPYARNARTHSDAQVAEIAASIKEYGWTNPILLDGQNGIIAGHGRLMAARKLGMDEVPTIDIIGLTDTQKRALILADNKMALNASWDEDLLAIELKDLKDANFDLSLTGFDELKIDELVAELGEGIEDDGEVADEKQEPPVNPVTREGDVWICGNHRVMCGDSTSKKHVETLTDGKLANFIHADPPYGMGKSSEGVANDNIRRDELVSFQLDWIRAFRPYSVEKINIAIWGNAEELWRLWYRGLCDLEDDIRFVNEIVWDKPTQAGLGSSTAVKLTACERCMILQTGKQYVLNVNSDEFPDSWRPLLEIMQTMASKANLDAKKLKEIVGVDMWSHWFTTSQFCLIPQKRYETLQSQYPEAFSKKWSELKRMWVEVRGAKHDNFERVFFDATVDACDDVWDFATPTGRDRPDHPTPKSLPMMERMLKICCPLNGLVLEPFGGSGQTLLAAENTKRTCYCMELQPKFVDMIVSRWQNLTGQKAYRESDGVAFDDLAN